MTYQEAIRYLESLINYEKISRWSYKESLKLERIKNFLKLIGNPQEGLNCIHIAGSKGKGSTCAFISYILREAGFKVGLYTSPHLSCFRERIRILNPLTFILDPFEGMISEEKVVELVEFLKPYIEIYNRNSEYGNLSFFEVYTALAFVYFRRENIDFLVLETGLGGRLDATNVVDPLVCGITPISYEHTRKLGNTLSEIAFEKAGIIKKGNSVHMTVISAPQDKEAEEVIKKRCEDLGIRLYRVGYDILWEETAVGFDVWGIFGRYSDLKINLLGRHQLINATVAIGVIETLRFHNIVISMENIKNGLCFTRWPGRCEVISKNPLIVLDGAQNTASMAALKETIKESFSYNNLILIFGICRDKDIRGVASLLYDVSHIVILTKAANPRAAEPSDLIRYFEGKHIYVTKNIQEAIELAKTKVDFGDLILITGSLFVVGEARDYLIKQSISV
ncbi:MAG: bifunctional folylpolyglutamate synthase/dihydrofolate synthase [Candidatus Omnitrophica bacterium]|nr:bifunctional folylpolyglutamate synthase/dihydrofolate synthase [Candidatus Omnitrophota bacterium]